MPSFVFTSPDGKSYTVNGPEGATAEQAFGILQQQLGAQAQPAAAPEEGIMSGAGRVASDIAKQFAAPVAAAPFQIPRGAELGIKGLARQSMEGTPEAIMPTSVYQPGLDTEEALFGPETQQQTAQRKLGAQRAVAAMPSIPGAETLSKIGDDVQKNIQNSLSKEGKKALRESQITGNIFKGEIDFGKNPTVEGYALQVANVFGSMAAPMATTLLTKSPGLGGAVGGAMAADEAGKNASEFISKMSNDDLAKNSPLYAELIAGGASPEEAKQLTIKKAAETGAALQGLVATFGDAFTGKLITGQFDNIITKMAGKTKVGRAAGAGLVGGSEESLQETMEGLASDVGIKATVKSKELGEDSASNLVMGFLGGAGPAGVRGLVAKEEEEAAPPPPPPAAPPAAPTGLAGLVPPTPPAPPAVPVAAAPQPPAAPQTLEEHIDDMMQAAETPPVSQVTPAAEPAEEQGPAQDMDAMLEELRTAMGEAPVSQVTPTGEPSGTQAPEAVQAEAQGQEAPAAAGVSDWTPGKGFQGENTWTKEIDGKSVQIIQTGPKSFVSSNADAVDSPSNAFRTLDEAVAASEGKAEKVKEGGFGEMGLEDFQAKHPKPYAVAPGILQTDITKMSDKDVLDRYSRDDLVTLAKLLDTSTSGTKAAVLANIRKVQANRERMKDMTADQLNAMSAEELRDLVTSLGGNPAYKSKDALVKFASEWRDNSLKRTREMVAESNHVRYVVQSVKRGNQNISDENINRYAAELWDAVDPDTQKELYAKLLRKRALSLFAPPYMGVPPTIVSLRDEADRTKDDKEVRKLTDLADALQKLYDKTRESEKPAAKVESAPAAAKEEVAEPAADFGNYTVGDYADDLQLLKTDVDARQNMVVLGVGNGRQNDVKPEVADFHRKSVQPFVEANQAQFAEDLEKQGAGVMKDAMINLAKYGRNPVWAEKILMKLRSVGGAQARLANAMLAGARAMWENGDFKAAAERMEYFAKSESARSYSFKPNYGVDDNTAIKEFRGRPTTMQKDEFSAGPERAKLIMEELKRRDKGEKAPAAPVAKEKAAPSAAPEDAAKAKAKQDLEDALGDLSMILTKGTRLNIMPEDEQKLLPVLTRVMDAAFRLGYIKFKEAAKYVLDTIRSRLGEDAADQITLDHLQGAYIGMAGKYQDQGASSKKEVVSIESLEELEEEPGAAEEKVWSLSNPEDKFEAAQAVADHFTQGNEFASITAARTFLNEKFGIDVRPGTPTAKQADEAIEAGVVLAAQKVVADGRKQGLTSSEIYDQLVNLYNRQPNLAVRTSTSVSNQAYSTPVPLAFVASELAGITNKTTSVYEPTAGNGVLVIGADPKNLVLNELDGDRVEMLKRLYPDAKITQGNALETNTKGKDYQAVIENPPFGKVGDISNIDHDIALHSLRMLDDNGRAVLILGGVQASTEDGRREGYRGKAKREFYYELYDKYNVVDHFTVGGNLYAKQGTTYPVDVIVIDGIGKSRRDLPAADLPQLITSYEQLKEKLNESRVVSGEPGRAGRADVGVGAEGQAGKEGLAGRPGRPGGEPGTGRGEPAGGIGAGVPEAGAVGGERPGTTGRGAGEEKPGATNKPEPGADRGQLARAGEQAPGGRKRGAEGSGSGPLGGVSLVSGERVESGLTDRAGQEQETAGQVTYNPHSQANSVGTLVPRAMADAIEQSLARVEAAEGNLDEYVATSLDMDPETVRQLFSAEQVDALALAIRNAEEGKGFIIGDQTGVGKGRVVAAMIRYALVNDKIPIFVTEKPNLYADMIRDLDDIGMTDELGLDTAKPKILITNTSDKIPYKLMRVVDGKPTETELILKAPSTDGPKMDGVLKRMQEGDSLGEYKVIFTTYNQMQTIKGGQDTERRRFIKHFGAGNYMIFDESHNAGGAGETQARTKEQREKAKNGESLVTGRAAFVRDLVRAAYGTFFSSATYAKRPDVMDLYSSTDMKLAVERISDLADAIKQGGIPMQQTVAQMLTQVGQYIRRERTFAGVAYNTVDTKVDKGTAENMATSMRDILAFSRAKEVVVKGLQKEMDRQGAKMGFEGEKTKVQSANFGSSMHSLINQMLLSLKAQDSVRHAIERLQAGEKVVLTVANTMGSFLAEYADEMGLNAGDKVDLSFADLYLKYLDKQRMVTIKRPGGKSEPYRLTDQDLGPQMVAEYNRIKEFIENAGFGAAPISPIDYMHAELRKAKVVGLDGKERNVQTDEITGRELIVSYESGSPVLSKRKSDIAQRVKANENFNNGNADVIILNQSGSTGISLHASSKFKDQRKRHMIIVQPEANIDTHMQMLGRVHRTGQVIPPSYSQMMADIPAEMRPAAILLKKMASLNANTTASRKSAVTAEGAVDFMNDYGGQIVHEYLRDNPEVYAAIGGKDVVKLAEDPTEAGEDDIRRFTGYIPVLPIKQQEEIYKEIVDRYNELIQREDSMGTNKLEAKAVDLDAKTISAKQITEDKGDPSVFAQPAIMEQVDVKRTVKPFSRQEVEQQSSENLKGMTVDEFRNLTVREAKDRSTAFGRAQVASMEGAAKPDPVAIEKFKNDLNAQYAHVKTVIDTYPIGSSVSIKNTNGVFVYGVVTNIESKGKTRNPVAGSDWKMTLALANGDAKSITINFSQIGTTYTLANEETIQWLNPETLQAERIPLKDLFDKGAQVRREKRWMVTGNILAGYAAVGNTGQIMTYTKDDGTTAQGILMPRTFDFEKQQKNAPVKLSSPEKVMAFLEKFGSGAEVSTENGVLKIQRRGNQYKFITPSSKRDGGSYFLDKDLIKIVGDFAKSGPTMSTTVYYEADLEKALKYIMSEREESFVAANNKEEAREAFQVPLKNIEPDAEMISQNPNEVLLVDRDAMIRKYQSLRQQRASVIKKFMRGEAGLNEQLRLTVLEELGNDVKSHIEATKEERRSAKNFFADATKAWDQGVISDDVYAVIKTLYEKFPFVLESLKFSVTRQPEKYDAAGQFFALARLVRLYKGTNGVTDPVTVRHEIVHSLEQMMDTDAAAALVQEWMDKLGRAMKTDKSPKAQTFFQAVMEFIDDPSLETYEAAVDALPSYDYYQYVNPSEYWAVNAEPLMKRKLGSGWDRFVLAVKRMFEGLKSLVGFDNQYAVHKAFNAIMNAQGERITRSVLADYVASVAIPLENQNVRRNYKGGPAPLAEWTSPNESRIDDFIYRVQDKHVDTKRVVQAITDEIGDIEDQWDPYLREELYHGRVAKQTTDFLEREMQPMLKEMVKRGVQLDELEEFLHNRHAKEYNELVAARNPGMPDEGSGIKTQDALDYLNNLNPKKKKELEYFASQIDKFVKGTQDLLVSTGMEKQETIDEWNKKFQFYVPLNRDPDELDFAVTGTGYGQGFGTKGKSTKTAAGSLKTVKDIFGNIALQRERAIIRSEKARVGRALYGLAITSPNPEFWMPINPAAIKNKKKLVAELKSMGLRPDDAENIIQEPRVPTFDKQTGQVKYEVNPALRNSPNVFPVRINGEDRFIFFNPGDPRAKRMVEALKNLDAQQMNEALNMVAELTRKYAAMNTQYNPVFGLWNFARDTMAGAINLNGTPLEKRKSEVFKNSFVAVRAIYRDLRVKGATTPEMQKWVDLFEKFQKAGGQTGYREQFSRSEDRASIVRRELEKLDQGNVRKAANALFDWLSDYNDAMENAVRLAAFKAALEEGMTEERAASVAKNLTVNFNRKGQMTSNINALFAFFNASVQGTSRMLQLLVNRTPDGKYKLSSAGKKIIAGGMLIGAIQAVALSLAGFDEDEPPEFLKNKNLIIPIPGKNYLIVPMPLGLNVFPNTGRILTEFAMSRRHDTGKLARQMASVVMDAFNPLGFSGLSQTISPTIADPFVALYENKDAFGRPISKEAKATNPTPGYVRNRESSTALSQGLSYALNYITGGGKYGIGAISPTADQLDYLAGQYAGGVGREVAKAVRFVGRTISGEEVPPYAVPIVGKMYGETATPSAVTDKFYKNVTMLAEHEGVIKRMREDKVSPTEYRREYPETKLIDQANRLENEITKINRTKKELQAKPETEATKARIKRLDEQKNRMMSKFNERVKAAQQ